MANRIMKSGHYTGVHIKPRKVNHWVWTDFDTRMRLSNGSKHTVTVWAVGNAKKRGAGIGYPNYSCKGSDDLGGCSYSLEDEELYSLDGEFEPFFEN